MISNECLKNTKVGLKCYLPLLHLSEEQSSEFVSQLTYKSKHEKKELCLAIKTDDHYLAIPRSYAYQKIQNITELDPANDRRSLGVPISEERCDFLGKLYTHIPQQQACQTILQRFQERETENGGYLHLSCGYGKTICTMWLITRIRRRALILVSTDPQKNEMIKTLRRYCPKLSFGIIKEDRCELDRDVVIASVQTLYSKTRDFNPGHFKDFGITVIDEAHHIPADCFVEIIFRLISSKHILGLTATPRRKDGRTQALFDLIGPILFSATRPPQPGLYLQLLVPQGTKVERTRRFRGKKVADYANMVNDICRDEMRNLFGRQILLEIVTGGGPCLGFKSEEYTPRKRLDFMKNLELELPNFRLPRNIMALGLRREHLEDFCRDIVGALDLYWLCLWGLVYCGFERREKRDEFREVIESLPEFSFTRTAEEDSEKPSRKRKRKEVDVDRTFEIIMQNFTPDYSIGLLVGNEANENTRRLQVALMPEVDLLFAIDQLGAESFNSPKKDTLVLLNPSSDMEQRFGRVQRGEARNIPLVIDLVDNYGLFETMKFKRQNFAKKSGFDRHVRNVTYPLTDKVSIPEGDILNLHPSL